MKPLPGQEPLFFPIPKQPTVPRPSINGRAGTPLDHRHTVEVWSRTNGRKLHGLYDESQRLYQSGGEQSSFIFWKRHLVTMAKDAWLAIADQADWIEMIDHEHNECWRILVKKAAKNAVVYDAGIGERVGVPMDLWDVITGTGAYRRRGKSG